MPNLAPTAITTHYGHLSLATAGSDLRVMFSAHREEGRETCTMGAEFKECTFYVMQNNTHNNDSHTTQHACNDPSALSTSPVFEHILPLPSQVRRKTVQQALQKRMPRPR